MPHNEPDMARPTPTDSTRWSLVERAAAGDSTARSVFALTYMDVVRGFLEARWRGTRLTATVEDGVQQVFLECLREGGVLARADPGRGDLRGLLFGVTRNVARRIEQGSRSRQGSEDAGLDFLPADEETLSTLFDREWARAMVHMAGGRMREHAATGDPGARQRVELLRLRFAEGLPIREIAAKWEMDPTAVHRAYERAREEFRGCLRDVVRETAARTEADLDREVERIVALLD